VKIVFVTPRWWPAIGGIESYARHVAGELSIRHDVQVIAQRIDMRPPRRIESSLAFPPPFETFHDGRVEVSCLRISPAARMLTAPLAAHVVPGIRRYAHGSSRIGAATLYARAFGPSIAKRVRQADVMHMWGGDLLGAAARDAARRLDAPFVMTPFAHREQWGVDPLARRLLPSASRVLALLEDERDLYRSLGVPDGSIEVVGVCSPGETPNGGARLRQSLGLVGPLVLFLGRRTAYKGLDLLLAAAPRIAAACPDVTFGFVGPGEQIVAPPGVRMIDAGAVDDPSRAAWIDAADVLCLPSSGEIFPSSFLEAWSLGTPVVTSDIPPLLELIGRSGGGLAVPRDGDALADGVASLLLAPERARSLGEAGRRFWAESFTVAAVTREHERIYRSARERQATR
jgi:glycosyltransferase involved in cell wall biosynthesis